MTLVTSSAVRAHLVRALEAELVGPYAEHEELDRAPSRTYLTGFWCCARTATSIR